MSFDVVVAADLAWGIGKDQGLPWPRLRGDLAHFRRITTTTSAEGRRHAIVMGRKTWTSKEVGARPLPRRLNVVVSRSELAVPEGVIAARSLDEALAVREAHPDVEGVFVVGGAGLLVDALAHPGLRHIYLTRVLAEFGCDVVIPDLDALGFTRDLRWDGEAIGEEAGVRYRIERLHRAGATAG